MATPLPSLGTPGSGNLDDIDICDIFEDTYISDSSLYICIFDKNYVILSSSMKSVVKFGFDINTDMYENIYEKDKEYFSICITTNKPFYCRLLLVESKTYIWSRLNVKSKKNNYECVISPCDIFCLTHADTFKRSQIYEIISDPPSSWKDTSNTDSEEQNNYKYEMKIDLSLEIIKDIDESKDILKIDIGDEWIKFIDSKHVVNILKKIILKTTSYACFLFNMNRLQCSFNREGNSLVIKFNII